MTRTPHPPSPGPRPASVAEALAITTAAALGVLGLGIPGCSACMLLPASFAEIARVRPGLVLAIGEFADVRDWGERERLLWPRGIHVSRSSVPAMALLREGELVAQRPGGGPAHVINRWLALHLGPSALPLGDDGPTASELAALDAISRHVAGQRAAKHAREELAG